MREYLPRGTMENVKNFFHIWWCMGWDLNPGSTKFELVLTVRQWFIVYQSLKTAALLRELQQVHKDIHTVTFHCSSLVFPQICCFYVQASWCHSWIMFLAGQEVATVDVFSGHHHLYCHLGNSVPMVHLPACTVVFSRPFQYLSDCFTLSDHKNQATACFSIMIRIQKQHISLQWVSDNKQNSYVMTC